MHAHTGRIKWAHTYIHNHTPNIYTKTIKITIWSSKFHTEYVPKGNEIRIPKRDSMLLPSSALWQPLQWDTAYILMNREEVWCVRSRILSSPYKEGQHSSLASFPALWKLSEWIIKKECLLWFIAPEVSVHSLPSLAFEPVIRQRMTEHAKTDMTMENIMLSR